MPPPPPATKKKSERKILGAESTNITELHNQRQVHNSHLYFHTVHILDS